MYRCSRVIITMLEQGTTYVHPLYCWGKDTDFDNFTCRLYEWTTTTTNQDQQQGGFEMDIVCTQKEGCTCSQASIQHVSCDLCETCTKFSTSDIATWTVTPWIVPNVHLSCPADNIYELSQACPTRISPSVQSDFGWFVAGIIFGGVLVGAAMTTGYRFRQKTDRPDSQYVMEYF